jgi:inner membrane transporter RhtA
MATASMVSVQLGLAVSVGLMHQIGAAGAAWLRLVWAAVILLIVVRPKRSAFTRSTFISCVMLGVITAGITLPFMAAIDRIPLGTASAIEFLGPLGVAVAQGRGVQRLVWPGLAAVGIVLMIHPWAGTIDPIGVLYALAAAVCWAGYVVLTQRVGDGVAGINGLAVSMPAAALAATVVAGPAVFAKLTPEILLLGAGLAVLVPVVPFALEMMALRRMTTAAFGTLMSLEPAFALIVGLLVLAQVPTPSAITGICLVVAAGIGAARGGARSSPEVVEPPEPVTVAEGPQRCEEIDDGSRILGLDLRASGQCIREKTDQRPGRGRLRSPRHDHDPLRGSSVGQDVRDPGRLPPSR